MTKYEIIKHKFEYEKHFNKLVNENDNHYTATLEGNEDMTSNIKSSILGSSVNFPIKNGIPQIGIWQGVYLCEHRNQASSRQIIITIVGE